MTSDEVMRALALLLVPLVAERLGTRTAPGWFSQLDGQRPPGCGRAKYLRTWRRAREAGDPGAMTDGRARLLTAECYARHRPHAPKPKPKAAPTPAEPRDAFASLLAAHGLERAS